MSHQASILVMVDVAAALKAGTLEGNTYLVDNMKLQGSVGEGTGELVTAINGTYWSDGSQADEQVLNWVVYSLRSVPPTVPRNFHGERIRENERKVLEGLASLDLEANGGEAELQRLELRRLRREMGTSAHVKSARRRSGHPFMDVRGRLLAHGAEDYGSIHYPAPMIANITGEAVDEQILCPAQYQYGCFDPATDGWYWSASVDTSRPGTYAYTLEIHLHEPRVSRGEVAWRLVGMRYESRIRIVTVPKRNGFTRAGVGMLPIR